MDMNLDEIKEIFTQKSEEKYRDFSGTLINNSTLPLLGVRLPELKKLAVSIDKNGEAVQFLEVCDFSSIEMCLLYSYVLGRIKRDIEELLAYFEKAAAHADNWCTCDILCQSFKQCKKQREKVWVLLEKYIKSGETYLMRIAVVMMMSYYLTDEYIARVFEALSEYNNDGYYYKMGAAWCAATAFAKYPDRTYSFLQTCSFDDFTFNKAIQKMLESRRVSGSDKIKLRAMKRKKS